MPPRRVPKTNNDQNSQNEITGGRMLRTRKTVDIGTTEKEAVTKQEKNIKKKVKKNKSEDEVIAAPSSPKSSSELGSEPEDGMMNQETSEVASSSKKPRMTYVVPIKNSKTDLNDTFVIKPMPSGKGKRNAQINSDSVEEQSETKNAEINKNKIVNDTKTNYSAIDLSKSLSTHTKNGEEWNLKISSWNVDGLRAWIKKDAVKFLDNEKPDILCLQETKCSESKVPPQAKFEGYHSYFVAGEKEGYSGVALLSKEEPISIKFGMDVEEHDNEGRLITAEYKKFYLVTTYVPNAGRNLVTLPKRLSWDAAFRKYLENLDSKKPVILCGDMNVAHKEIDIANPKTNTKNAGFTKEERDGMTELLALGFVDTFRHLYPDKTGAYTFWTYLRAARSRNIGWRLDYFIVSDRIIEQVCDSVIRNQILGSDHCPITLLFHNK